MLYTYIATPSDRNFLISMHVAGVDPEIMEGGGIHHLREKNFRPRPQTLATPPRTLFASADCAWFE